MNEHKPTVKPNRYFIRGVRFIFNPIPNVAKQRHEPLSNFLARNAYVFLVASILASPFPGLVKHFRV
jgi:hypothetical protein